MCVYESMGIRESQDQIFASVLPEDNIKKITYFAEPVLSIKTRCLKHSKQASEIASEHAKDA